MCVSETWSSFVNNESESRSDVTILVCDGNVCMNEQESIRDSMGRECACACVLCMCEAAV